MCEKVIIMHEGAQNGGFCAESAENEGVPDDAVCV